MAPPTKCTPKLAKAAEDYLESYKRHGHVIPSIAGLALVLGISRITLQRWRAANKHKAMCYILEMIATTQEVELLNGGLTGEMNSNIVKLALGKHGYGNKAAIEHSGSEDRPLRVERVIISPK